MTYISLDRCLTLLDILATLGVGYTTHWIAGCLALEDVGSLLGIPVVYCLLCVTDLHGTHVPHLMSSPYGWSIHRGYPGGLRLTHVGG